MNDRLLKKLILEMIQETLDEADSGDKRRYEVLVNDIGNKLEEAAEMAKSLGKSAEYSELRSMMVSIDELIRMHGSSDEDSEEDFDEDYDDEEELNEQTESPDLLKSLKSRLRSMNGSDDSGYGSWDEGGTEWDYDDAEGGYYHTATVNFENPEKVEVSGSDHTHKGKDKVFPLRQETDVDAIISYVESISGLSEGSSSGEEDYDDED